MQTRKKLSIQEAAALLNVSCPYMLALVTSGKIPFHFVDTKKRMFLEDVLQYKEKLDNNLLAKLDKLVAEAQKNSMGY